MLRELIEINPRRLAANPRKKKGGGKKKHRVTYRRNPRLLPTMNDITKTLLPALIGGGGALALSIGLGQITFIPEEWKGGAKGALLRAGAALGLGFGARYFLPSKFASYANSAMVGAITVIAFEQARKLVSEKFPELTLGMYDGDLSAYERVSYDALPTLRTMGAYVRGGSGELNGMIPAVR